MTNLEFTAAADTLRCFHSQLGTIKYGMSSSCLQSYASAIAHFVDCLQTGADFENSPADNLRTLALVGAIHARGGIRSA